MHVKMVIISMKKEIVLIQINAKKEEIKEILKNVVLDIIFHLLEMFAQKRKIVILELKVKEYAIDANQDII